MSRRLVKKVCARRPCAEWHPNKRAETTRGEARGPGESDERGAHRPGDDVADLGAFPADGHRVCRLPAGGAVVPTAGSLADFGLTHRPNGRAMTTLPDSSAQQKEPVPAASAVHLCLLLGRILFNFGATTQRVQDSIVCLARYLGCEVEILVSHDALLITVNQGPTFRTRIDAAHGIAGLNLLGLVQVSGFRVAGNLFLVGPESIRYFRSLQANVDWRQA